MPTFIAQGRYSREAVRGMTEAPEDRTESVSRLIESLGGKLHAWYLTTGDYDWLIVAEAPDQETMMAAAVVAGGSGGVSDMKTITAYTGPQAKAIFERAKSVSGGFKAAGRSRAT